MDEKIMHEVRYTIEDAKKRTSDGREVLKRVDKYFDLPDLNIIWGLVAATRLILWLIKFIFPPIQVRYTQTWLKRTAPDRPNLFVKTGVSYDRD